MSGIVEREVGELISRFNRLVDHVAELMGDVADLKREIAELKTEPSPRAWDRLPVPLSPKD